MHELSVCQALLEQVEREVSAAGLSGPVIRLSLSIGRLSGVHVHALRFAFEVLSAGTLAEGAELDIAEPRAVCDCRTCGQAREIEELSGTCAACGSTDVVIREGRELRLESIELADDP